MGPGFIGFWCIISLVLNEMLMRRVIAGILLALMITPILLFGFTQKDFNSFLFWGPALLGALGLALFQRFYAVTDGYDADDEPSNFPRSLGLSVLILLIGKTILFFSGHQNNYFVIELVVFFVVFLVLKIRIRAF